VKKLLRLLATIIVLVGSLSTQISIHSDGNPTGCPPGTKVCKP
jgi:hypothetical protein